jgi:hypothetical protein
MASARTTLTRFLSPRLCLSVLINLNLTYAYDFFISASYAQVGLDSEIAVTDWLSIVPSAVVGYGIGDYYSFGTADDAFTHVGLNVSFPITLTKTATLTPYIAANFSLKVAKT